MTNVRLIMLACGIQVILFISLLLVGCGGDESANPLADDSMAGPVFASTTSPLTEATLNNSVVTLTLGDGAWERLLKTIGDALTVSGIDGVTIGPFEDNAWFGVNRVSDKQITVELRFKGNIDTDAELTFTVGADAIAEYNGPSLTAQVPVTAVTEEAGPVFASTTSPLTEATLNNSVVTLTLGDGAWERSRRTISDALTVSGIDGVTIGPFEDNAWFGVNRVSDKQITVELRFKGNIDTDAELTFTVGADAIAEYNGPSLTAQVPVTAVTEDPEPPPEPPKPSPEPEPPLKDLGTCAIGMTLKPGESCSYVAGEANVVFSVRQDGTACREGGPVKGVQEIFGVRVNVNIENQNICRNNDIERDDAFNSNLSADKNADGSWTIKNVPR